MVFTVLSDRSATPAGGVLEIMSNLGNLYLLFGRGLKRRKERTRGEGRLIQFIQDLRSFFFFFFFLSPRASVQL